MLPKSSLNQGIQSSFNIDDILNDNKLSFLVDKTIKREFYYYNPISEGQVYNLRKVFNLGQKSLNSSTSSVVPINEMTRIDIMRGADAPRLQRSKDKRIIVKFLGVTEMRGWLRFDVTSQYTPGKHYLVYVKLKDAKDIKYLKEFKKRDVIRLLLNGNLYLHCSCPDWKYRMSYQSYQMGYGLFKELRYPHIANPKLTGTVCKHVLAVLRLITLQWLAISKALQNSKFFKKKYEDEVPYKIQGRVGRSKVVKPYSAMNRGKRSK